MSVEFYRGSPGKFDSRTLSRETLSRWTGRSEQAASGSVFDAAAVPIAVYGISVIYHVSMYPHHA